MLQGKKILLAVTGSIAAYKSAFLVRLLVKKGAEVQTILTPSAKDFITPLTLSTLSNRPSYSEFVLNQDGEWTNHVELGLWADLILVAPASANTLGKMASGIADNLVLATYLSARCPVYFAPAMDLDMYKHDSVSENIESLLKSGNIIIPPGNGELASGLSGEGRMAEPQEIIAFLENSLFSQAPLRNKKVLITAGPTYEAIDPVRFIGNHSSGKMGFAIAEHCAKLGATVTLVSGPVNLKTPKGNINRIDVVSAKEMFDACAGQFKDSDIAVMSAAVADFTPAHPKDHKIKKNEGGLQTLELEQTLDILGTLGQQKTAKQILVGFALETNSQEENALKKLTSKNCDLLVLNSPTENTGFGTETNSVTIFTKDNKKTNFELKSKQEIAVDIVNEVLKLI